jgi:nucleotide-binding universal stress UspA family protein
MSFTRILLAVDQGPVAARAADAGASVAKALGAEVGFVYVVDPGRTVLPGGGMAAEDLIGMAEEDGRRVLSELRERAGLPESSPAFVVVGKPAAEIVKTAKEWPADLVVIGSHGRQGIERVLLGSVAEAVGRSAHCSVLVVRTPE